MRKKINLNKPVLIYLLLMVTIVLLAAANINSNPQKNENANTLLSLKSADINSQFGIQAGLSDVILKEVYKYPSEKIHNYIKKLNKSNGFNGSVLVAKKGKILFEEHIGKKDLRHKDPIENTNTYQLASLSKQFTAAAILLLYQDGKINLDGYASNYLKGFPYKKITIRQLLNHTSGLPNYMWATENKLKIGQQTDNESVLKLMNHLKIQAYFKPGSKFDYSNTGYFILATIVSQVSNQNFGDFLDTHFFRPLKMNHTYAHRQNEEPKKDELVGFRHRGRRYQTIPFTINDGVLGDKGIYSTVNDLFKWSESLTNNDILNDTIQALAFEPGKTIRGKSIPYGFGYRLNQKEDLIYHNGVWNGFSNTFRRYDNGDITIIILSNDSFNSITPVAENLYKLANAFSKYDKFVSFVANTNIFALKNLENHLSNFSDIPKPEAIETLNRIEDFYRSHFTLFMTLNFLDLSNPFFLSQQFNSYLN